MNYDHQARHELICGISGSGKTTLFLDMFAKWPAKWKFALDRKREIARKLKLRTCVNWGQMKWCVEKKYPVLFDYEQLFPGNPSLAWDKFCRWAYEVSRLLQGVKLFACDEVQFVQEPGRGGITQSTKEALDDGRKEEIDFLAVANRGFNTVNDAMRQQITGLYVFRQNDENALKALRNTGFTKEELVKVRSLRVADKVKRQSGQYIFKRLS